MSQSNGQTYPHRPGVLELIKSRLAGERDDYVLGLTLEGGGMRGIISAAMLLAMGDLGITDVIDRMYGTSSGAINLAYFAAGGRWDALSIYYDHLPLGFLNPAWLVHKPRLNMAFVAEEVMNGKVPLDTAALARSTVHATIALSNVDTMQPELVRIREVADDIRDYLVAGAWLPILAGPPVHLQGRRYLDGGLLSPDPLYPAITEGCTHVLMVNTAPEGALTDSSRATMAILHRTLNRWTPGLGDASAAHRARWAADKLAIRTGETIDLRGTAVLRLRPAANSHRVRRLTMDRSELLDGARAGYQAVCRAFGRPLEQAYFAVVGH